MRYAYYICDVFTDVRFGGNQLAVLPSAEGLSTAQMQAITREFNFAESSFVLPAVSGHTRRVRIFTPAKEIPFAGHPNVGTAFTLATTGAFGEIRDSMTVEFEENAGIVCIRIERRGKGIFCELTAPEKLSIGKRLPPDAVAAAVSLTPDDFVTDTHAPQVASVGLPFIMVQLKDRAALERARINTGAFDALAAEGVIPDIHMYVRSSDDFDIRARMFGPLDGVPEDPATGSANCALAAMLTHYDPARSGTFRYRISQGVQIGRPSVLEARIEKRDGALTSAHIGGESVLVSEGWIEVG
ncbi:MAG TPA: PhzF family phenazine biosynthesis protein [Gemmatimonadaceae bacterium]|nr:PhzF family phenazine biosynthesis protein [Gemmatimonadaceae bacterium]